MIGNENTTASPESEKIIEWRKLRLTEYVSLQLEVLNALTLDFAEADMATAFNDKNWAKLLSYLSSAQLAIIKDLTAELK